MRVIKSERFLRRLTGRLVLLGLVVGTSSVIHAQRASDGAAPPRPVPAPLTAPTHLRLPADASRIWLVPARASGAGSSRALADFSAGMRLFAQAKYAEALPLLGSPAIAGTPVAAYAGFYRGLCSLNLARPAEARTAFAALHASEVTGFIAEAAIAREAEAAAAQADHAGAARLYEELSRRRTASPDAVLLALGREYQALGARSRAAEAFSRLYYDYPLGDLAVVASTELEQLKDVQPAQEPASRLKLDLVRAERLFAARRFAAARPAFEALDRVAAGDDAEIVALRLAECDVYLRHYRQARERLAPYLERASRQAEARFFSLTAARELGARDEYVRLARELVADFPGSSWAEETLNGLATHYILDDDDERADAVFRELYAKFPQGSHAERAAWKSGWWAYKHGKYDDASAYFEGAATTFPRSDYRPAYLYWSARARDQRGDQTGSAALYRVVIADYQNTYYGRLASKRAQGAAIRLVSAAQELQPPAPSAAPPTADLIRLLLSLELYDQAREELLFAQRTWGDSPVIGATLGWVYYKQGDFRRGIISMKRAYPQYMSDEGLQLPEEAQRVIFPLDYWSLIRKYSPAYSLDPYLVAALINQESAFDADIKSAANAVGLMQVLPSTGRRYAKTLRLRRYSQASLTKPEVNLQLGMAYFAELIRRFGGIQFALASYNAGESRVYRWNAERPGLELDEYIDDIPFPETQAYVKRIIGTTEDYRRLYGDEPAGAGKPKAKAAPQAKGKPSPPKKGTRK